MPGLNLTQSFRIFFYKVKLSHADASKSIAKNKLDKTGEHDTVQQAKQLMIIPPDNKWTLITENPTSVPCFSLSNDIDYFVLRKACDKESTNDFKNLLGKSYPLYSIRLLRFKTFGLFIVSMDASTFTETRQRVTTLWWHQEKFYKLLLVWRFRFTLLMNALYGSNIGWKIPHWGLKTFSISPV